MSAPEQPRRSSACRGIDWSAQPLGIESDTSLAKRLGVTRRAVYEARTRRNIAAYVPDEADWSKVPLGMVSDAEAARMVGRSECAAAAARKRRGIRPLGRTRKAASPKAWTWVDWSAYPLGEASDDEVAAAAGVHRATVAAARRRKGLPVWRETRICPCGAAFVARNSWAVYCGDTCRQACIRAHRIGENREVAAALAQLRSEIMRRR